MTRPFIDSNVILYLLSADPAKADKAEAIVAAGGLISVQVLNEVTAVCLRKLRMPWQEIDPVLAALKSTCEVLPLTVASHALAVDIAKRYRVSFYDAHICATAVLAGADLLFSEDLQNGMVIERLTIRNPFSGEAEKEG